MAYFNDDTYGLKKNIEGNKRNNVFLKLRDLVIENSGWCFIYASALAFCGYLAAGMMGLAAFKIGLIETMAGSGHTASEREFGTADACTWFSRCAIALALFFLIIYSVKIIKRTLGNGDKGGTISI